MSEVIYKKIPQSDEWQVRDLISKVLSGLERPEFFIPYADWELDSLFDENYALLDGAYINDKLVGMAQLYVKQEMLEEFKQAMDIADKKVAELGGNLILPEGRGQGIMFNMIQKQLADARKFGFDYVIAMAHPDNIASLKSLKKLGMEYVNTCTVANGYLRDTYWIKLS